MKSSKKFLIIIVAFFASIQLNAQKTNRILQNRADNPSSERRVQSIPQTVPVERARPTEPVQRTIPVQAPQKIQRNEPVRQQQTTVQPSAPVQQNQPQPVPVTQGTRKPRIVEAAKSVRQQPAETSIPVTVQKQPKAVPAPTTPSVQPAIVQPAAPVRTTPQSTYRNYYRDYRGYGDSRYIFLRNHPYYRNYLSSWTRIDYGGYPYYYDNGFYYSYYDGFYRPLFPPSGISINSLPMGYYPFELYNNRYYYSNGIFYRPFNNYYEVIDAPVGATVPVLPQEAQYIDVNGENLYELNGTYFKPVSDINGRTAYQVVGKYGEISKTETKKETIVKPSENNQTGFSVGNITYSLPKGSKVVQVKGVKYYKTTDNHFLIESKDKDNVPFYKVVGDPGK